MDRQRNRVPDATQILLRNKYSQAFREVQRDTFYGQVKANGELVSVKGFDELRNRITKVLEIDRRDVYSMLHEQAGDEEVERLLNMVLIGFPDKQLKPEDTWVVNVTDNTRAPMKYSNLIKYSGIENDTIVLKIETVISAKTGAEGTLYESGKGSGVWKLDRRSGLPYEWNSRQSTEYRTNYDTINYSMTIKGSAIK
jgi:hypothetical protein